MYVFSRKEYVNNGSTKLIDVNEHGNKIPVKDETFKNYQATTSSTAPMLVFPSLGMVGDNESDKLANAFEESPNCVRADRRFS